jgi:hypothetical protein
MTPPRESRQGSGEFVVLSVVRFTNGQLGVQMSGRRGLIEAVNFWRQMKAVCNQHERHFRELRTVIIPATRQTRPAEENLTRYRELSVAAQTESLSVEQTEEVARLARDMLSLAIGEDVRQPVARPTRHWHLFHRN